MLRPSDPLFWLIAVMLIAPWFLVIYLGQQLDKWMIRAKAAKKALQNAAPMCAAPPPLIEPDGSRVIPFEPRVIEGGKGETSQGVASVPFKGKIS